MTTTHFDAKETRPLDERDTADLITLAKLLPQAMATAPGLQRQLAGIDPAALRSRADLAAVPVLRKQDLTALQQGSPPFAGLASVAPGQLKRILISPGPIFDPEGHGSDWWGSARALHAAGFRAGDIVLNTFSYHFTPGGHIMESGAQALGCAVIPAGPGQTEQQIEAIHLLRPSGYVGTPDFLKILIEKAEGAGKPATAITKALVSGAAFPPSLQAWVKERGVDAYQCYATADLGVVAYETAARQGLIVNEDIIVEIVRPGTGEALPEGEVGELVVTRLNREYPLLRFGTGDLSKFLPGPSPCGRSNRRLAGWLGRADQRTKVKGMFVDPAQIDALAKKHPGLGRLRLVVTRENEADAATLKAESLDGTIAEAVGATLRTITNLKGKVEIVPPGSLPNDGKVIADERPIG